MWISIFAPSREKKGLRTQPFSRVAPDVCSMNAGSRFGWPGWRSHSSASMPLLERIAFHGGSTNKVPLLAIAGPYGSWKMSSQG
ncbi:hypothetical protein D3C85_1713660 [compost metagenome]